MNTLVVKNLNGVPDLVSAGICNDEVESIQYCIQSDTYIIKLKDKING